MDNYTPSLQPKFIELTSRQGHVTKVNCNPIHSGDEEIELLKMNKA